MSSMPLNDVCLNMKTDISSVKAAFLRTLQSVQSPVSNCLENAQQDEEHTTEKIRIPFRFLKWHTAARVISKE